MAEQLDVFFGEVTPHRALVYARSTRSAESGRWTVAGCVRGPYAVNARTLPMCVPLVDCGPGPTLLAQAVIPDPCGWSPLSPTWYDVEVEVRRDGVSQFGVRRQLGIRRFGPSGRTFVWESRRWVLRGIHATSVGAEALAHQQMEAWGRRGASLVVDAPTETLCETASRHGLPLVARLSGSSSDLADELRRLARWPAVTMSWLAVADERNDDLRRAAPNMCLVQLAEPQAFGAPAPWAQAVSFTVTDRESFVRAADNCSLPVIATRPLPTAAQFGTAHAACDELRGELAAHGEYAGYVV